MISRGAEIIYTGLAEKIKIYHHPNLNYGFRTLREGDFVCHEIIEGFLMQVTEWILID